MSTIIHRIADKAPEFPCWLYPRKVWTGKTWETGWEYSTTAQGGHTLSTSDTHWCHSDTRPTVVPNCVCGEPSRPDVVHRTDGPCYHTQPSAAVAPKGDAIVRVAEEPKMVDSPARCVKCGKTTHADTTGVLINRCHCGGELVSVNVRLPSLELSIGERYILEALAKKLAENANGDALKAIEGALRVIAEAYNDAAILRREFAAKDEALAEARLANSSAQAAALHTAMSLNPHVYGKMRIAELEEALADLRIELSQAKAELPALYSDRDQLRARLAAAQEDKERLDWLETRPVYLESFTRAAIDAARKG